MTGFLSLHPTVPYFIVYINHFFFIHQLEFFTYAMMMSNNCMMQDQGILCSVLALQSSCNTFPYGNSIRTQALLVPPFHSALFLPRSKSRFRFLPKQAHKFSPSLLCWCSLMKGSLMKKFRRNIIVCSMSHVWFTRLKIVLPYPYFGLERQQYAYSGPESIE
jgi:hypothetical protein